MIELDDMAVATPRRLATTVDVKASRARAAAQPGLSAPEQARLVERIERRLAEQDAVVVAHYYVNPEIQELAERTGGVVADSLEMARFGYEHRASTVIVAGVRFMGETAKILSPNKRVLMVERDAECSLDVGCPPDEFAAFCDAHRERRVVVYANTSAAVKARADWVVTSSIALKVVEHLKVGSSRVDLQACKLEYSIVSPK